MTTFPKAKRSGRIPSWLVAARSFYGQAFEPKRRDDLAEAMADWTEMSEAERSFVLAHLQYLGLLAERHTQRMLARLQAELARFGDDVVEALEAEDEPDDDEELDDDEQADEVDPGVAWLDEQAAANDDAEQGDEPAEQPQGDDDRGSDIAPESA